MVNANIRWVTGFATSMDWLTCTSIHLHLLSTLCQLEVPDLTRKKRVLAAVQQGMSVFNPYLEIPDDDDEMDEDAEVSDDNEEFDDALDEGAEDNLITLAMALTVMIRPGNAAPELLDPEQIWPMLADQTD